MSLLTATGAVVFVVLLCVAFQSAVKAMLPEFWKPGVPEVVLRAKFKVVFIKPFYISRLELNGDAASCFPNKAICDVIPICPTITAEKHKDRRVDGINEQYTTFCAVIRHLQGVVVCKLHDWAATGVRRFKKEPEGIQNKSVWSPNTFSHES